MDNETIAKLFVLVAGTAALWFLVPPLGAIRIIRDEAGEWHWWWERP